MTIQQIRVGIQCLLLWRCSTGTDPVTESMTLGLVAKVQESGTKTTKKRANMLDQLHLPDRM